MLRRSVAAALLHCCHPSACIISVLLCNMELARLVAALRWLCVGAAGRLWLRCLHAQQVCSCTCGCRLASSFCAEHWPDCGCTASVWLVPWCAVWQAVRGEWKGGASGGGGHQWWQRQVAGTADRIQGSIASQLCYAAALFLSEKNMPLKCQP